MTSTQTDLDAAHAKGLREGLQMALKIAEEERSAAKSEEKLNLAASVRERTEVRRKYAEIIAGKIRKVISTL